MNEIRVIIDEAHRTRKCDTFRAKGKEGVEITPSRDMTQTYVRNAGKVGQVRES